MRVAYGCFFVTVVVLAVIYQMRALRVYYVASNRLSTRKNSIVSIIRRKTERTLHYSTTCVRLHESSLFHRQYESAIWNRGTNTNFIIGVDEAGRGPLAGPVVAAAAFIPREISQELLIKGIDDSKKITEKTRFRIYQEIIKNEDIIYSSATAAHDVIDRDNILQATLSCMQLAVESLVDKLGKKEFHNNFDAFNVDYCIALIDGNKTPSKLPVSAKPVVKGDSLVYSIALASIIAKVERDLIMVNFLF